MLSWNTLITHRRCRNRVCVCVCVRVCVWVCVGVWVCVSMCVICVYESTSLYFTVQSRMEAIIFYPLLKPPTTKYISASARRRGPEPHPVYPTVSCLIHCAELHSDWRPSYGYNSVPQSNTNSWECFCLCNRQSWINSTFSKYRYFCHGPGRPGESRARSWVKSVQSS